MVFKGQKGDGMITAARRIGGICVVMTMALAGAANGQTAAPAPVEPRFADLPWGSPVAAVDKAIAALGLKAEKRSEDGDAQYFGKLFDHEAVVMTMMSPKGLVKVHVGIAPPGSEAIAVYRRIVSTVTPKYGAPAESVETYAEPYSKGDGMEGLALRAGKATFKSLWVAPGTSAMLLEINKDLMVTLVYESAGWSEESERRTKKAKSVF
jgi:hypothetical protein